MHICVYTLPMTKKDDISRAYKEAFNTSPASVEDAESAVRSLADDVIDNVTIEPAPKKNKLACNKCGGLDFEMRGGLGSPMRVNKCLGCGTIVHTRKKRYVSGTPTHAQGVGRGPTYSERKPLITKDKNLPRFKAKSKPRRKDD